jgi:hypothetical protein
MSALERSRIKEGNQSHSQHKITDRFLPVSGECNRKIAACFEMARNCRLDFLLLLELSTKKTLTRTWTVANALTSWLIRVSAAKAISGLRYII